MLRVTLSNGTKVTTTVKSTGIKVILNTCKLALIVSLHASLLDELKSYGVDILIHGNNPKAYITNKHPNYGQKLNESSLKPAS